MIMLIRHYSKKYFSIVLFVFCSILIIQTCFGEEIPSPTSFGYLNDYVGVLSNEDSTTILSIGKELQDKTGAQAIVVVIDTTKGIPIEDYSLKLFRSWGIGQKEVDNGLLILLAINDHAWRVEVGRGLEGAVPDILSNQVMESLAKPSFVTGNYDKGLVDSYSAFCDYIAKEYSVTLEKSISQTLPVTTSSSKPHTTLLMWLVIIGIVFDLIFNRGRVVYTLSQLLFWNSIGRGGRGGGRGGGGFGGFGGGSSNGGGSSGNW